MDDDDIALNMFFWDKEDRDYAAFERYTRRINGEEPSSDEDYLEMFMPSSPYEDRYDQE